MRNFLLGKLRDPETNQLEIELLVNDERFEQMRAVEIALVDDYVRNVLSAEEKDEFETHYLASPIHLQRVRFARQLIAKVDETPNEVRSVSSRSERSWSFLEKFRLKNLAWEYALVPALLLFVAATVWLLRERSQLHQQLSQITNERASQRDQEQALAEQVATVRDQNERMAAELENLRSAKGVTPAESPAKPVEKQKVFSFALSPILLRGSSDPQTVSPPADTEILRLQMRADAKNGERFKVTIRTVEGSRVWQQQSLKPRLDPLNNGLIIASVPTSKLPVGDYILTLTSVNTTGSEEEVNRYFFRIL